jgi:hypothetical protein
MILTFFGGGTEIVYAEELEPPLPKVVLIEVRHTAESIERKIEQIAEKYGVDAEVMKTVIDCESSGSTTIQSYHKRPDGSREQSYGLAQIYLPAHPTVTKEQATDPIFAIDFMAKQFSKGNQWMWSCYNDIYGK